MSGVTATTSVIEVALAGARVAFTTRQGGVSEGPYRSANLGALTDDLPERVAENRRRTAALAGLDPYRVAMGWQVHGSEVREWSAPPAAPGYAEPGAPLERVDGHTTCATDLGLLVLAADCLPVALASPERVAMLHCGWRGLAGGIIGQALRLFDGPVAAAIGPGIGRCCYEVGPDVLQAFADLGDVATGRMLDLPAVTRTQLARGGVTRIDDVGLCTSCRPDLFFSHRRDRGVTGRQAGLVWRER